MEPLKFLFHLLMPAAVFSFNLNVKSPLIYSDRSSNSDFGFTVALLHSPARVYVGAPKALPEIKRPGLVYDCSPQSNTCRSLWQNFDPVSVPFGRAMSENASIGGAMDADSDRQVLVVCGPGWKNHYQDYYLMNGVCYITQNGQTKYVVPLIEEKMQSRDNLYLYSYGQAGFSVHVTKEGSVLMGAPGVWGWTGSIAKMLISDDNPKPNVLDPMNVDEITFHDYFGYSLTSGRFLSSKTLIAAAAPRAALYHGKVVIFDFNDENINVVATVKGDQMGEYFGATMATSDVDNDSLDDLFVGAPLYSTLFASDLGAVYVYNKQSLLNNQSPLKLIGSVNGGRFGTAINGLNDFDRDGFNDVAIGAPYEDHGLSQGTIYIYKGSVMGLSSIPSQRITASEFSVPIRGFGFSISRALDVDGNHFPDLAVGAFLSGHAVLLKSKSVVQLKTRISRSTNDISNATKSITFQVCYSYGGPFADEFLDISANLTVDPKHRRLSFDSVSQSRQENIRLVKGVEFCKDYDSALKPSDLWSNIAKYASLPISVSAEPTKCDNCPVVEHISSASDLIPVTNPCGKRLCFPRWLLNATILHHKDVYELGSSQSLPLEVFLGNGGESGHVQRVTVEIPDGMRFRIIPSFCARSPNNESAISCFQGYLLHSHENLSMQIPLELTTFNASKLTVNVTAFYYDSSEIVFASASLPIVTIPRAGLKGYASPSILLLGRETGGTPVQHTFTHTYEAYCDGYTPLFGVQLQIVFPTTALFGGISRKLSNVSHMAQLGSDEVSCYSKEFDDDELLNTPSWPCSKKFACSVLICDVASLKPKADALQVILKLEVDRSTIDIIMKEKSKVPITSVAYLSVQDTKSLNVIKELTTTLEGKIADKEDPLLPLYICLSVAAAILILWLIIYALARVGFFLRKPQQEKDEALIKDYQREMETNS